MGRMTIDNPNMLKLLPQFMRNDEANVALSHAMDSLLAEPAKRSRILRKWDQIDNMNHTQLDEMAWEFNIDWWDSAFTLEQKRAVIKTCYRIHEKRGTKWAVEELVTAAFGMGKVTEWFEYGGDPYWFKIRTSATLTKDGMAYFLSMIDKVKSARSHVEMIEVTRTIDQNMHAGTAQLSFAKCVILDHFHELRRAYSDQHAGAGKGSYSSKNTIQDHFALAYTASATANAGTAAGGSRIRSAAVESFTEAQTHGFTLGAGVSQVYYTKNTIKEE